MTKITLVFDLVFEINILNDNISFVLEDFRKSNLLATSKKIKGYEKKYKDLIDRFNAMKNVVFKKTDLPYIGLVSIEIIISEEECVKYIDELVDIKKGLTMIYGELLEYTISTDEV